MREPKNSHRTRSRFLRRALIVSVILASPVLAERPTSLRILPPLPLSSSPGIIKGNPFCTPSQNAAVQLASGEPSPAVRLKPIGAAIGLHSIEHGSDQTAPMLVVEAARTPPVRTNTLVESAHHENNELVDTTVDEASRSSAAPVLSLPPSPARPAPTVAKAPTIAKAPTMTLLGSPEPEAVTNLSDQPAPTIAKAPQMSLLGTPETAALTAPPALIDGARPAILLIPPNQVSEPRILAREAKTHGFAEPSAQLVPAQRVSEIAADDPRPAEPTLAPKIKTAEEPIPSDPVLFSFSDNDGAEVSSEAGELPVASEEEPIPRTTAIPMPVVIPEFPDSASESTQPLAARNLPMPLQPVKVVAEKGNRVHLVEPVNIKDDLDASAEQIAASASQRISITEADPRVTPDAIYQNAPTTMTPVPVISEPTPANPVESIVSKPKPAESIAPKSVVSEAVVSVPVASKSTVATVAKSNKWSDEAAPVVSAPIAFEPTVSEPIVRKPTVRKPIASEPVVAGIATTEPVLQALPTFSDPTVAAEPSLHDTRYRPPVAVTQVPLGYQRSQESAAIVRPTVTPVQALRLEEDTNDQAASSESLTPLYMSRTQIRSLTIGGRVREVKVGDQNVCQAFATGPNKLKLIGTGNGVTRLVVWADTDNGQKPRMRAFEIHVKDSVAAAEEAVGDRAARLNSSLEQMFPNCRVTVQRQADHLLVSGNCDSEQAATKIIRMVRKTCLIPVRDALRVR